MAFGESPGTTGGFYFPSFWSARSNILNRRTGKGEEWTFTSCASLSDSQSSVNGSSLSNLPFLTLPKKWPKNNDYSFSPCWKINFANSQHSLGQNIPLKHLICKADRDTGGAKRWAGPAKSWDGLLWIRKAAGTRSSCKCPVVPRKPLGSPRGSRLMQKQPQPGTVSSAKNNRGSSQWRR